MQKTRRGRDEQTWRDLVERQAQSGLSVKAFCQHEGLKAWSLYRWRSRLRARNERPDTAGRASAPPGSGPGSFIDLGALESDHARCEVRIELGGGIILRVVRG